MTLGAPCKCKSGSTVVNPKDDLACWPKPMPAASLRTPLAGSA